MVDNNDYFLIISSKSAATLSTKYFANASAARVQLSRIDDFMPLLNNVFRLWIDTEFDGLSIERPLGSPGQDVKWCKYMKSLELDKLQDNNMLKKPDQNIVNKLVIRILNKCLKFHPSFITVPQFPVILGSEHNKINKALSHATKIWRSESKYNGKFVFPLIFTHQEQTNLKANRTAKLKIARECLMDLGADILWVVDSSLPDDSGSETSRNTRFPSIINLHKEIQLYFKDIPVFAGPYWGLNLVLWTRNIVESPVIGVGSGFQYRVAGGSPSKPKIRLALSPMRRRIFYTSEHQKWIENTLRKLTPEMPKYAAFEYLLKNWGYYSDEATARRQIIKFYAKWIETIRVMPKDGRALALYQDLSSAYVLGRSLDDLPDIEKTARRPEKIAEQLMINCL